MIRVCLYRLEERCTPSYRAGGSSIASRPATLYGLSGEVGEKVTFGSVLAVHTDDKKVVLGPDVSKVTVTGKIVSQGRAKKLTVLKFKKGNQYKISRGHPQNFTAVQVSDML
jgi:large subunit ribosomal protein L21